MKILNLYAGIGGNRKLWGNKHDITAVESDPEIAEIYKELFPNDTVVADAHEYLRLHFKEFDFIWSSPPCQTHSQIRQNIGVRFRGVEPKFPDMTLYEEIIFLMHNTECMWVVENVRPYYKPLIKGQVVQRHLFWSSFDNRSMIGVAVTARRVSASSDRPLSMASSADFWLLWAGCGSVVMAETSC